MKFNLNYIKIIKFQFFILIILFISSDVIPQSFNLATGNKKQPIEITADDGIEWQRENQLMVATGNAKAARGNATIEASTLRAYYQKNKKGETKLTKIEASQKVKIKSPTQRITGQNAIYDLEKAILVVSGKIVKLVSGSDIITSNQHIIVDSPVLTAGNPLIKEGNSTDTFVELDVSVNKVMDISAVIKKDGSIIKKGSLIHR